jgi:hypothetical protein
MIATSGAPTKRNQLREGIRPVLAGEVAVELVLGDELAPRPQHARDAPFGEREVGVVHERLPREEEQHEHERPYEGPDDLAHADQPADEHDVGDEVEHQRQHHAEGDPAQQRESGDVVHDVAELDAALVVVGQRSGQLDHVVAQQEEHRQLQNQGQQQQQDDYAFGAAGDADGFGVVGGGGDAGRVMDGSLSGPGIGYRKRPRASRNRVAATGACAFAR